MWACPTLVDSFGSVVSAGFLYGLSHGLHPTVLALLDDLTWGCYNYGGYKRATFLFQSFLLHLLVGTLQ